MHVHHQRVEPGNAADSSVPILKLAGNTIENHNRFLEHACRPCVDNGQIITKHSLQMLVYTLLIYYLDIWL